MIEYACLSFRKMKTEELEEHLNRASKKGWRVKCSAGECVIMVRDIEVK